jgi:hypothetical protein
METTLRASLIPIRCEIIRPCTRPLNPETNLINGVSDTVGIIKSDVPYRFLQLWREVRIIFEGMHE